MVRPLWKHHIGEEAFIIAVRKLFRMTSTQRRALVDVKLGYENVRYERLSDILPLCVEIMLLHDVQVYPEQGLTTGSSYSSYASSSSSSSSFPPFLYTLPASSALCAPPALHPFVALDVVVANPARPRGTFKSETLSSKFKLLCYEFFWTIPVLSKNMRWCVSKSHIHKIHNLLSNFTTRFEWYW